MENFNDEFMPGNVKTAMKEAGASSSDLWMMKPEDLTVHPEFNVRVRNTKYEARVAWLTESILANGYYKDKPITAFVADVNGTLITYIVGGHRRLEAVQRANLAGAGIEQIPVVIKPRGTNMEDLTVDLKVGNEGDALTTYEEAVLCKRMVSFGHESAYIAKRMGFESVKHVDNLLLLASAPSNVRKLVEQDQVSATTAIETLLTHGGKAFDVLQRALEKSTTGRVTPKNLPEIAFKNALKRSAPVFYTALTQVQKDPAFNQLSPELQKLLTDAIAQIPV